MTIEQKKLAAIGEIVKLQDEQLLDKVCQMLEEVFPLEAPKLRKPGWGKGTFTYIAEDFDEFIPPGFDGSDKDRPVNN